MTLSELQTFIISVSVYHVNFVVASTPSLGGEVRFILKECLLTTIFPFTDLINMCLKKGVVPDKWKEAVVVAIPKGGSSKQVSNV